MTPEDHYYMAKQLVEQATGHTESGGKLAVRIIGQADTISISHVKMVGNSVVLVHHSSVEEYVRCDALISVALYP